MIPIIAPVDIELDDLVLLFIFLLFDESVSSISNGLSLVFGLSVVGDII